MDKRYQVFVSSTYTDLKEERRAVIQTVIELDCIPAGMELFPATEEEQFAFIKRVIDDCDYYLLIIGGRYGSVAVDGVSYTEKEFDYAVNRRLPVIALVHEDPGQIVLAKSEQDPALREKLEQFKKKVCTGRVVKPWRNAHELPGFVSQSLSSTIHRFPAIGWVRADKVANEEILAEINDLRKSNADLAAALADISPTPALPDLAGLNDETEIPFTYWDARYRRRRGWSVNVTWREVFFHICAYLMRFPTDEAVKAVLQEAIFQKHLHDDGSSPAMDDQTFRTVALQLQSLGLVNVKIFHG